MLTITPPAADGFEEIPSIEEAGAGGAAEAVSDGGGGAEGDDSDVPDIGDLELEDEEEDEVGAAPRLHVCLACVLTLPWAAPLAPPPTQKGILLRRLRSLRLRGLPLALAWLDTPPHASPLCTVPSGCPQAALRPAARGGGGAEPGGAGDHILRTRTYDLLITYDKYYAVGAINS